MARPSAFEPARTTGGFHRGEHLYAPVRTLVVVERYGCFHGLPDLLDAVEHFVFEKLVFQRVIDALRLGIILGIARFCHADTHLILM